MGFSLKREEGKHAKLLGFAQCSLFEPRDLSYLHCMETSVLFEGFEKVDSCMA